MDHRSNRAMREAMIANQNALAAQMLECEVDTILEADASNKPWSEVDKAKLPAACFLWVEDPKKKSTWHLPYREGAGGVDPKTGMYRKAGAVNMGALRAIAAAVKGARTGEPMKLPAEIATKIERLLKQYGIGDKAEALVTEPYPNQHACRLREPDAFEAGSFRTMKRSHEGKTYSVIMGRMMGKDTMMEQAYRYDKATWTAAQARAHCAAHKGHFEAATGESMQRKRTVPLQEFDATRFAQAKLDKDHMIVRHVAVMRSTSANSSVPGALGRRYEQTALDSCARLVQGAKCYLNHQDDDERWAMHGVRRVDDLVGHFEGGVREDGTVYADLHYIARPATKDREWFEALVEKEAERIGLSIVAMATSWYSADEQTEVVDDIKELRSTDLVSEPGSTKNLFEARSEEPAVGDSAPDDESEVVEDEVDLSNLTLADLKEHNPSLIEQIVKETKDLIAKDGEMERVKTEAKTLREENTALKVKIDEANLRDAAREREQKLQTLVKESGLPEAFLTPVFMEALRATKDDAAAKALLEDRKKLAESTSDGVRGMGAQATHLPGKNGGDAIDDAAAVKKLEEAMKS